jgi:hypothetical protein
MASATDTPRNFRFPWGPLIALYSAITFFMLGIDMALLHLGFQHFHFMAVMPVVFCVLAAILAFITTFSVVLRRQAWVLGVLAMLVGLVGTVIHLEIAFANMKHLSAAQVLERLVFDPRPPLAPAALAGTGLLLFLITLAEFWPIAGLQRMMAGLACRWPWLRTQVFSEEPAADAAAEERDHAHA